MCFSMSFKLLEFCDKVHDCSFKYYILGFIYVILIKHFCWNSGFRGKPAVFSHLCCFHFCDVTWACGLLSLLVCLM